MFAEWRVEEIRTVYIKYRNALKCTAIDQSEAAQMTMLLWLVQRKKCNEHTDTAITKIELKLSQMDARTLANATHSQ